MPIDAAFDAFAGAAGREREPGHELEVAEELAAVARRGELTRGQRAALEKLRAAPG